jgi:hypothetical protein
MKGTVKQNPLPVHGTGSSMDNTDALAVVAERKIETLQGIELPLSR